jgi:hypothetical protein
VRTATLAAKDRKQEEGTCSHKEDLIPTVELSTTTRALTTSVTSRTSTCLTKTITWFMDPILTEELVSVSMHTPCRKCQASLAASLLKCQTVLLVQQPLLCPTKSMESETLWVNHTKIVQVAMLTPSTSSNSSSRFKSSPPTILLAHLPTEILDQDLLMVTTMAEATTSS